MCLTDTGIHPHKWPKEQMKDWKDFMLNCYTRPIVSLTLILKTTEEV